MSRVLATILMVFWGLWFGGSIALFIFVSALFRRNRSLAMDAAPVLFLTFERYHLILAGGAIVLAGIWIARQRTNATIVLFVLFMLAGLAAAGSGSLITPRIEQLRQQHQSGSPEFKRLHGYSMMVYSGEAIALLAGGVALSVAIHRKGAAIAPPVEVTKTTAGSAVRTMD